MNSCIELQGKGGEVVVANILRAGLYSSIGDFVQVERMLCNAELNNGQAQARAARFSHLTNHGFATEAMKLVDDLFANRSIYTFVDLADYVVGAGGFNKVIEKVNTSLKNNEVLKMTGVLNLAKQAASVMAQLDVNDVQMASMLDLAGEILRSNKLYWQGDRPDVHVLLPENGGPSLTFDYHVFVAPEEAARMNWELTESLVGRELDVAGIHIGFVGTKLPAKLAA